MRERAPLNRRLSVLAASAISSTVSSAATAAAAGPPALEAGLAIHGTVPARFEWNGGLLSAPGTDHACTLRSSALISAATAARLLVLLGLAAGLAAFRRRVSALTEEILILRRKCEGLPAIATEELLIFSHISLSLMLQLCAAQAANSVDVIELFCDCDVS